jgi:hypothetical protein
MMKFKLLLFLLIVPFAFALDAGRAQNPMVIVQAASPAPVVSRSTTAPAVAPSDSSLPLIKLLQEMKATNAETLKKQEAVLQQLDEIGQAAEQMKAFSQRS